MTSEGLLAAFKNDKIAVLIPTFNNEQTIGKVITDVLEYTTDIIVVNDGSTDSTPMILKQFPNIRTIHYPANKGKGYALRTGFRSAIENGYDYVISIDSDGQHFAKDLPRFIDKLRDHPQSIIMGVRDMEQAGIPGKSSFGHKFSNFWFWVETGIKMNDTQSGYRLYPVKLLQPMTLITRKFEFEIEVMVRAAWKGIEIAEVPVSVFYAKKENRVSHFRPFQDFTRISILNTVLVTIAFLYIKPRDFILGKTKGNFWSTLKQRIFHPAESDWVKSLSVGFGVFMGIFPVWGFQLLIAIALAFVFRLNKALVIIAANISIPPMIPVILFLSYSIGSFWMGEHSHAGSFEGPLTLAQALEHSRQYIAGAITLSLLAGLSFTVITWLCLKLVKLSRTA